MDYLPAGLRDQAAATPVYEGDRGAGRKAPPASARSKATSTPTPSSMCAGSRS
ncbi:hypothetical protein ACRAWD_01545 [Caulobacter segnis]